MNTRMDRSRMQIGTYCLAAYAQTEQHIRDIADGGINFVIDFPTSHMVDDRKKLDRFAKYNVGLIAGGVIPCWIGGNGSHAGTMADAVPMTEYANAAARFSDHPAIWGLDCGDEPSALDFDYYGKITGFVDRNFRNQFPYVDLYPNYASVAKNDAQQTANQLGTATYQEYIDRYCEKVGTDYIAYDYYIYSAGLPKYYENQRIISEACRRTGRSMWMTIQANSDPKHANELLSVNRMRFQAFSSLAFGAEVIIWACYTAGWWHHNALDEHGEKTAQYEKIKQVNREIATISGRYMGYRCVATHFVGFADGKGLEATAQKPVAALDTGVFRGLRAENGEGLVVGQMVSRGRDGACALMVCAADDPMDENEAVYKVRFRADTKDVQAVNADGQNPVVQNPDGSYTFAIRSNSAVLITAK